MLLNNRRIVVFWVGLLGSSILFSQNEAKRWHFGNQAALDFNTNPPTPVLTSVMSGGYSSASVADASGNLLFYTNGSTVWDKNNTVMANGTGLNGNGGGVNSQGSLIVKKPGSSTIYYIFHSMWNATTTNGLYYSEVDVSLASGNGSVTVKNIPLTVLNNSVSVSKLTATRHCNGTDIWVTGRNWLNNWNAAPNTTVVVNNDFRSYLVTSGGINTTAVVSPGSTYTYNTSGGWAWDYGCMKISPNGKKLAVAYYNNNTVWNTNNNSFELFDFDNTTGIVSNSLALMANSPSNFNYAWGVEFSPDGTKLYGSKINNSINGGIFQWDLCAGSTTAIVASCYTVQPPLAGATNFASLQMATNGKIYCARTGSMSLDVINNPNAAGAACNFVIGGQSLGGKYSNYGLPNFMGSHFIQPPPSVPFTYTVSNTFGCQTASFNSVYSPTAVTIGCASQGYSLTNIMWDFGDPGSGANNYSSLSNPFHSYPTLGTYSVNLILYYSCGGGTDTIKQVINVNQPCISVSSTSITCANLGSATVQATGGIGPYNYTWTPTGQTNSVATGLSPGSYTLTVYDFGNNYTYTATTTFNSLIPLTGNLSSSNSVTCNGASTGTASYSGITGGSSSQNYLWTNGSLSYTSQVPTNLSAGLWSVTVTDALTGCKINDVFYISQPPALSLNLSSNTSTACATSNIVLTGTMSGGTPGYTYSWTAGPTGDTHTVTAASGGAHSYTLTGADSYSCPLSSVITVTFVNNPVLSLSNVSICPQQSGTLQVSGATSYTWLPSGNGSSYVDNPISTTAYTVIGTAQSCTAMAVASIVLKTVPSPSISSNSPVCNGQNLQLNCTNAGFYVWSGPNSYISNSQINTLPSASPGQSGTYQVTVTAVNGCTASTAKTVTIHPTPTVSATGGAVCSTQTLTLSASSIAGANYYWQGPNGFSSNQQNPSLNSPVVSASGNYTVRATSVAGCSNTAVAAATITAMPNITSGSDSPKCFGKILSLFGNSSDPGVSYSWNGPNGFSSNLQNPSINAVTVPASGVYNLQASIGPCTATSTTQPVVINPLPTATITSNSPVCQSKQLNFSVISAQTIAAYFWQYPNSLSTSTAQYSVRDTAQLHYSGIYTITLVDVNGCKSVNSTSLEVMPNPVLIASGDTVCLNSGAKLKVQGADTYKWYNANGVTISTSEEALISSATFTSASVYTVVGKSVNTCTSVTTATVMTRPLPIPDLSIEPANKVCLNTSLTLKGYGATYYTWAGPGNSRFMGEEVSFKVSNMAYDGVYTLTATDTKGCSAKKTTTLTVNNVPGGSLQADRQEGCVPFTANLYFKPSLNASTVTDHIFFVNKRYASNQSEFSYAITQTGDYLVEGDVKDVNGCSNKTSVLIKAYQPPVADFNYLPEKPKESMDEVVFTNASRGADQKQWDWYYKLNEQDYHYENQSISRVFDRAGIYPVVLVVLNKLGCSDTIVKTIKIEADFNVFVPSAFTPNGDGINEVFIPVATGIKKMHWMIFDRWGKKVFETSDFTQGWNGHYEGELCQSDVYTWKMTVSSNDGQAKELTGSVTLFR